ncbi:unnamed protein product [Phytophthora lilii]|uniref:Unnamed protein product n=1 Tax=Phytophthora lilii TaxID=2077276 RepID=A0A9W6TZK2_9STRA|nr:unnamed protein product [Phytophthora lilii]
MKVEGTKDVATSLRRAQLEKWKKLGKSTDDVFVNVLKLDDKADDILTNPKFDAWVAYNRLTEANPEAAVLTSLKTRYGENGLSNILEMGTKVDSVKDFATTLQTMQLKNWKELKKSADDVFANVLMLSGKPDGLLANPRFSVWSKYLEIVPRRSKLDTPMIDTLRNHYTDDVLARNLVDAQAVPSTKSVAMNLKDSLVNKWVLERLLPKQVKALLLKSETADDGMVLLSQTYSARYKEVYGRYA